MIPSLARAGALLIAGQILNLGVFYRLGIVGVLFGGRLGHEVTWCRAFPFSWFSHPQYVGTVLTIWGFFGAQLEAWETQERLGSDPETQHV